MFGRFLGNQKGLTLIELIIAVAIVAILVGIAVPSYRMIATKSKVAEAMQNLDGIKLSEESYKAENDEYHDCAQSPVADDANITSTPTAWVDQGVVAGTDSFADIGYQPQGDVRYSYVVTGSTSTTFTAQAHGDLDDDDNVAIYELTEAGGKPDLTTPGEM